MIQRSLSAKVSEMLDKYPIVSLTGPRQSGNTTLARMIRPDYQYVNLENLSTRAFAQEAPQGFLETYQDGVIIDEAQHVPELFSYLQVFTEPQCGAGGRQQDGKCLAFGPRNFVYHIQIAAVLSEFQQAGGEYAKGILL